MPSSLKLPTTICNQHTLKSVRRVRHCTRLSGCTLAPAHGDRASGSRRFVYRLNQRDASSSLTPIADWKVIVSDCMQEVLENHLMSTDVRHKGGAGALIPV